MTPPDDQPPVTGDVMDDGPTGREFLGFVAEQRNGGLLYEISEALAQLSQAVQQQEKPGSLRIDISMQPGQKGTGLIIVRDSVTLKAPKPDRPASAFFVNEQGTLSRDNPRQMQHPDLRRIERPQDDLRRPGGDT